MTSADDGNEAGQILLADDPNGALIIGATDAVAEFVARWSGVEVVGRVELDGGDLGTAVASALELGVATAQAAQYLRLRRSAGTVGPGELRLVERGTDGRFVANSLLDPLTLLSPDPVTALAVVAVQAALEQATQELREAIRLVEDKADEVLRLASADRAGDVNGHYRMLRRMAADLDDGAALTDTDWSTVASLGPMLEVGVERLRDYATRLVGDLPAGLPADERAERLDRVVAKGRLGEALRLLVVAEQSLYLWQRLRVARFERAEPQHVRRAVDGAHSALAEHLEADGDMAGALRVALEDYAALRPLEFHRMFSGRRLRGHLAALREDLDYFLTARGLQVESWDPLVAPSASDALAAARTRVVESGRSLRVLGDRVVDESLAGIERAGGAVAARAEQWRAGRQEAEDAGDTPERPSEGTNSPG